MWSPIKLDFSFYDFSMIFQNSPKINIKKIQTHRYCSKPAVKKPPRGLGGKIDDFGKFRGKTDGFIVEGVK